MAEAKRRLAAILSADVAGYSRLMGDDERATLDTLNAYRDVFRQSVARHEGRVVDTTGDSVLAVFGSVVEAVQCATDVQAELGSRNENLPDDRRMLFRIGVNLGDVIEQDDGTVYGDGINIAARLESLAEPGGINISGTAFDQVLDKLDFGFDFLGEQEVKNIAKPIPVYRVLSNGGQSPAAATPSSGAILDRPAVAVLPLTNMSGDPEQEYFADGLTEDMITALAAWRSFPVIARNSTFAYKDQSRDVRKVGSELGARYVLEGSVRKSGNRLRITIQLIDATTGHHVWAEKFDRELDDIFELQDEITQRVAATVQPALGLAEQKRSMAKAAISLDAWDYYLRGMSLLHEYTNDGNAQARDMFDRAIALDATYSLAFSGLAWSHVLDLLLGQGPSHEVSCAKLLDAAQQAVTLDEEDSIGHLMLSIAYMWPNKDEASIAEGERALELNPSNAMAYISLGNVLDLVGRHDEGIEKMERGLQLNPLDRQNHIYMTFLARAYMNARQYEQSVEWARKAIQRKSDYASAHFILAVTMSHLGREDEARAALEKCESLQPGFVDHRAAWRPYRTPTDNDHIHEGLRKLGLDTPAKV